MALQLTIDLASGITVTNAYHKVVGMNVTARGTGATAFLEVATYLNSTKANENAQPVLIRTYNMGTFNKANDAVTAAAQAYTYLKTLSDYTSATDV